MKMNYRWAISAGIFSVAALTWYATDYSPKRLEVSQTLAVSQGLKNTISTVPSQSDSKPSLASASKVSPFEEFSNNLPRYLSDTEIRGQLSIQQDGSLIITDEIRKLFDYFYIMIGDRSQAEIHAIIVAHIQQQLVEPAQGQALQLLQQYTDYLTEYDTFNQGLDIQAMQDDPQWVASEINNMRIFHLGEETQRYSLANKKFCDRIIYKQIMMCYRLIC